MGYLGLAELYLNGHRFSDAEPPRAKPLKLIPIPGGLTRN